MPIRLGNSFSLALLITCIAALAGCQSLPPKAQPIDPEVYAQRAGPAENLGPEQVRVTVLGIRPLGDPNCAWPTRTMIVDVLVEGFDEHAVYRASAIMDDRIWKLPEQTLSVAWRSDASDGHEGDAKEVRLMSLKRPGYCTFVVLKGNEVPHRVLSSCPCRADSGLLRGVYEVSLLASQPDAGHPLPENTVINPKVQQVDLAYAQIVDNRRIDFISLWQKNLANDKYE